MMVTPAAKYQSTGLGSVEPQKNNRTTSEDATMIFTPRFTKSSTKKSRLRERQLPSEDTICRVSDQHLGIMALLMFGE